MVVQRGSAALIAFATRLPFVIEIVVHDRPTTSGCSATMRRAASSLVVPARFASTTWTA
jgi:hypothetical protein